MHNAVAAITRFRPRPVVLAVAGVLVLIGLVLGLNTGAGSAEAQVPDEPVATTATTTDVPLVLRIDIAGPIGPATAGFVVSSLEAAIERDAAALLIRMDTPGGLDLSTRDIIKSILNSPIPVITFVAPEGARAASAGTYILYASHVAAMSPATHVGAATPVSIGGPPGSKPDAPTPASRPDIDSETETGSERNGDGDGNEQAAPEAGPEDNSESESESESGTESAPLPGDAMSRKVLNDAVAYIRGLADRHGRNVDWAELAVREAASITAEEALEIGVIDLIARDAEDLFAQADGRTVALASGERELVIDNARIEQREPDWKTEFLGVITSPTIAYILLLIGVYGLILEGYNPGAILPGVVGAICLLLALYAFQMLPVNYAGFGLIALGVILMIAEALAPSFGVLGIGGIIALVIGSIILIDTDVPGFVVSRPLIGAIALASGVGLMAIIGFAMKARQRPMVAGREELIGSSGEALETFSGDGFVFVHGERWRARSQSPIEAGSGIKVVGVDGLTLEVEPAD
ncbi:NfeD family protein [Elongatibacter sediminis]|uniref:Nodulation protein NfeD n=1 Tax=Elongatibacter sediminis TaxID=3119006 RepID=A0AAW9RE52_9GAMM